jgi:hypothetical protein
MAKTSSDSIATHSWMFGCMQQPDFLCDWFFSDFVFWQFYGVNDDMRQQSRISASSKDLTGVKFSSQSFPPHSASFCAGIANSLTCALRSENLFCWFIAIMCTCAAFIAPFQGYRGMLCCLHGAASRVEIWRPIRGWLWRLSQPWKGVMPKGLREKYEKHQPRRQVQHLTYAISTKQSGE